jgi:hypothetical protein
MTTTKSAHDVDFSITYSQQSRKSLLVTGSFCRWQ